MRGLLWAGCVLVTSLFLVGATMATPASAADRSAQQQLAMERINLNTATVEELVRIRGIGDTLARRIVEYRDQHGPFRSVDDLLQVKGIGEKKLEAMRPFVTVE